MAAIIPLSELKTRPPEHGRIRLGERYLARNGKTSMRATEVFRFTSYDREAIEQLAVIYGGTPKPWSDPKAPEGQWEVLTTSNRISVWLPPNPYNVAYERWGGKGCERRCDGAVCTTYGHGTLQSGCLCAMEGERTCKITSRVQLILPDIKMGGVWRLESKSENFAYEAPGMMEMIYSLQERGIPKVDVVLTKRSKMTPTGKTNYIVPQFEIPLTPQQVLGGEAQVRAAITQHPSSQPALALAAAPDPDDEVVDAELVDDGVFHQSLYTAEATEESNELLAQLERSVEMVREQRQAEAAQGWDIPPPGVRVVRNPDPTGPKWVKAQ